MSVSHRFVVRPDRSEASEGPAPEGAAERVLRVEVPHDLVYFEGHFEGNPMLPGLAQVLALVDVEARRVFPELAARGARKLSRLKFQATIRPGDVLELGLALEPGPEPQVRFRIDRLGEVDGTAGASRERAGSGALGYTA